jgi:hypothetical protein
MSDENEMTAQAFWEGIHAGSPRVIIGPRATAGPGPATAEPPAAEEAPSADDINGLSLDDYAGQREAFGVRDTGEFLGIGSWKYPERYEEVQFSAMDEYAEERAAAGIKDTSVLSGATPATPRTHSSPYSI